jgi:hypothetical protein
MSIEDIHEYAKIFRNGWKELIHNDELNIGSVCVIISKFFMDLRIVLL